MVRISGCEVNVIAWFEWFLLFPNDSLIFEIIENSNDNDCDDKKGEENRNHYRTDSHMTRLFLKHHIPGALKGR